MSIYKAPNLIINPKHMVYRCVCVWEGGNQQ